MTLDGQRLLANIILHRGTLYKNTILEIKDNSVVLTPFEQETAATSFISGIVAVCDSDSLTPAHQQKLNAIATCISVVGEKRDLLAIANGISDYLKANNLYYTGESVPRCLIL